MAFGDGFLISSLRDSTYGENTGIVYHFAADGSVIKVQKESDVRHYDPVEILFLGDILFNYGDFSENGHVLIPPGYCEEWWVQELEKATVDTFGSIDNDKLSELTEIHPSVLKEYFTTKTPSQQDALTLSKKLKLPLHPDYTYYWTGLTLAELKEMIEYPGPFVLDVQVPYQEHVLPMIPSGMTVRDLIKK